MQNTKLLSATLAVLIPFGTTQHSQAGAETKGNPKLVSYSQSPNQPAPKRQSLQHQPAEGKFSTAIIQSVPGLGNKIFVFPKTRLWAKLADQNGGAALDSIFLLEPGSLLFVAENGLKANTLASPAKAVRVGLGQMQAEIIRVIIGPTGTSGVGPATFTSWLHLDGAGEAVSHPPLLPGEFYEIGPTQQIVRAESGKFSVHAVFAKPLIIYSAKASTSTVLSELASGDAVQLLIVGGDSKWHKVRTLDSKRIDGWIQGTWESASFVRNQSTSTE